MGFRLKSGINKKNSSSFANERSNHIVKLSKNVVKAKKIHTSLSMTMYISLCVGIIYPLYLIIATAMVSYLYFNKKAKQRMYVSTAAYNLQVLKLDKAKKLMEKAKNIFDNEIVRELEKDINNVETNMKLG